MGEASLTAKIAVDEGELRTKLALAQAQAREFSSEVRKLAAEMNAAGDAASAELKAGLGQAVQGLTAAQKETASLRHELAELSETSRGGFSAMRESIEGAAAPITRLREDLAGLSELFLAGFGIERAFESFKTLAETGEDLEHIHEATGISIEDLSALRLALKENGADWESFAKVIPRFGQAMQEAVIEPNGKAAQAFAALGIQVQDAPGHFRPLLEVLIEAGTKLDGFADDTNRNIIEGDLFGQKLTTKVTPALLEFAREGIEEARRRSQQLGVEWSGADAEGAHEFAKGVADLGAAFEGLEKAIADTGLLDALTKFTTFVGSGVQTIGFAFRTDDMAKAASLVMQMDRLKENIQGDLDQGATARAAGDQKRLDALKSEFDELVAKIRAARTAAGGEGEHPKPSAPAIDGAGTGKKDASAYLAGLRADLAKQLDDWKLHGAQALAFEDAYWAAILAKAKKGIDDYAGVQQDVQEKLRAIHEREYSEGVAAAHKGAEEAKRGLEEQKRALDEWWRDYRSGIRLQIAGNPAGAAAALEGQQQAAKSAFGAGSPQYNEATDQIIEATNKQLEAQEQALATYQRDYDAGVEEQLAAARGSFDQQKQLLAGWLAEAKRVWGEGSIEFDKVMKKQVEAANEAAQKEAEVWRQVNDKIADSFISGLEGKHGGLKKAIEDMFKSGIEGLGKKLVTGLLADIEGATGLNKINLSSLFGESGGGGLLSSLFGGSATDAASGATLNTAGVTLNTAGAGLTAAATALSAAATTLGAGGAFAGADVAGSAAGGGGIFGVLGDLLPLLAFADGGEAPGGRPYLVGERGPEIRINRSPGTILPNSVLAAFAGGGSATYGGHTITQNNHVTVGASPDLAGTLRSLGRSHLRQVARSIGARPR
ncbi:MAG TPA: hypothetical protein VKS60_21975 [Stellaceae bacterium]|nr:hypothetical protein [Stellaceae bacterium]